MVCVATCVSASSMEIDIPRWWLSRYLHRYLNLSKGKWKIVTACIGTIDEIKRFYYLSYLTSNIYKWKRKCNVLSF